MYRNRKLPSLARGDWLQEELIPLCVLDSQMSRNVDLVDQQERENVMRAYYGLITHIDHQIGFFLGDLRERGLLEDTFIVYFSDYGDLMWDHGAMFKAAFYEGSARVPLILRPQRNFDWAGYGWKPGQIYQNPVALYDIMPTLLEVGGAEVPPGLEAVSLFADQKRIYLFGDYDGDHFVTDSRYKYLWHKAGGIEQMFDLESDPKEEHNLASSQNTTPWKERLTAFLAGKDTIVNNGRLVAAQYPSMSVERIRNAWHARVAHF